MLCMCALLLALPVLSHATLKTGPWLQAMTPTSVTVMWEAAADTASMVAYGPAFAQQVPTTVAVIPPAADGTPTDTTAILQTAKLTGLTPGTTYAYQVVSDGIPYGPWYFTTHSNDKASWKVAHLSDTERFRAANAKRGLASVTAWKPDYVIIAGDLSGNATNTHYRDHMAAGGALWATVPHYTVRGNHDVANRPWSTYFHWFDNELPERFSEDFYAFDVGPARYIGINANQVERKYPEGALPWLEAQLQAATTRPWTVVFMKPNPATTWKDERAAQQRFLMPLFVKHGVDLVLAGGNSDGFMRQVDGVWYVHAGMAYKQHGYFTLNLTAQDMLVQYHQPDGTVVKQETLTRNTPPPIDPPAPPEEKPCMCPCACPTSDTDQYGGQLHIQGKATGQWHLERLGDTWWFVTPEGHGWFFLGVSGVNDSGSPDREGLTYQQHVQSRYAQPGAKPDTFGAAWRDRWAYSTRERLKQWGFTAVSTFSYPPVTASGPTLPPMGSLPPNALPQVHTHRAGREAMGADRPWRVKNLYGPVRHRLGGASPFFPDVFDPQFAAAQQAAVQAALPLSPWTALIFLDQTDEMRGTNGDHVHLGLVAMSTAPTVSIDLAAFGGPQTYTDPRMYSKYAARDVLRLQYVTVEELNRYWHTDYTTWESDGGWPAGRGVLDEDGRRVQGEAVQRDLEAIATAIIRQWYSVVSQAWRDAGITTPLSTNNLVAPHAYVYEGLRSADGAAVYVDVLFTQDAQAGHWADVLGLPVLAGNLGGYYTAEADSALGYSGTVDVVVADDAARTLTMTCHACDFWWAGDPTVAPVHRLFTQFSSLPGLIERGSVRSPQLYESARADWLSPTQFVVRQRSYFHGQYQELRDSLVPGQTTFARLATHHPTGPFSTQAARGVAWARDLTAAVQARSPQGVRYVVGANWWAYKDTTWRHWEIFNFGLVTAQDTPYDGQEGTGDALSALTAANRGVYALRKGE